MARFVTNDSPPATYLGTTGERVLPEGEQLECSATRAGSEQRRGAVARTAVRHKKPGVMG